MQLSAYTIPTGQVRACFDNGQVTYLETAEGLAPTVSRLDRLDETGYHVTDELGRTATFPAEWFKRDAVGHIFARQDICIPAPALGQLN